VTAVSLNTAGQVILVTPGDQTVTSIAHAPPPFPETALRVDQSQSLSAAQKALAVSNAGIGDPWTTTALTVTGMGTPGAFAATSSYSRTVQGKNVLGRLTVTVTAAGTATGFQLTLPDIPVGKIKAFGVGANSGFIYIAQSASGAAQLTFYKYDGTLAIQVQVYDFDLEYEKA
jgi:hypothetical protein